ncbi:MAG: hypothetical protein NTY68_04255 [Candidatus Micrarchaeota archaeon]|nr:hypothetical protein [Candidatus Micrarchaeota archaeon]
MSDDKKPDFKDDNSNPETEIRKLTDRKQELIEKIKRISKGLKYKTIELKALEPLEAQAEKENPFILIRKLKKLEFRLSTQASTPKMEKVMMKEIMDLERQIRKVKPLLTASSRIRRVREDLKYYEGEMVKIESELKTLRERLKGLIDKRKEERANEKKGISYQQEETAEEHFTSLEDMADKD